MNKQMRRLFIIRKDLHLSPGKLAAMVGHCSEAYWTNMIKNAKKKQEFFEDGSRYTVTIRIDGNVMDDYINGLHVKTICEAKNLYQLKKAISWARKSNLSEGIDWGIINDKCFTEITPENDDGTSTVGIWFAPMPDEKVWDISKKYQLYMLTSYTGYTNVK